MSYKLPTAALLLLAGQGNAESSYQQYMTQYAGDYSKYMQQGGAQGSQGGDYQKYMDEYSGDYSKYMHSSAEHAGGSQASDYQKYVKQYAGGDYGKYTTLSARRLSEEPEPVFLEHKEDENATGNASKAKTQASGYQEYTKKYSGDYDKYMQQGGQSRGSQSGDYQKYMKQYAADYEKYMQQGNQSGGSQSGDYKKYMEQYAGDYNKYMQQGGQSGGSQGDYQQYMKKYAGDYNKYMQQGGQSGGNQSGDYQKYMKQYAGDYSKYMQHGGNTSGAQSGDYQQYLSKYAGKYNEMSGPAPVGLAESQHNDTYAAYMKKYAGDYTKFTKQNGAQGADYQQYMKQYSGNYTQQNGEDYKEKYGGKWVPAHENMTREDAIHQYANKYVEDVHNTSDYKAWGAAYQGKYAGSYEGYMKHDEHAAQQAPCASAADCKSVDDLQAWRTASMHRVDTYVPQGFQAGAKESINSDFEKNKVRIQNANATAASNSTETETASSVSDQATFLKASKKSASLERTVDLSATSASMEQGWIGGPAMLGMIVIGGAAGVFVATRKRQDDARLEGYTSLLV